MAFKTAEEVTKFIKDEDVEFVDVRFTDVPGVEQHFTIPAAAFDEDAVTDGLAFDGSSVRGFTTIDESDMNLLPDLATAKVDPFRKTKTLNIKFFVHDPFTREPFSRDPRNVARKAEEYLASTGIADTCNFGLEAEFYLFDKVKYEAGQNTSSRWTPTRAGGTAARTPAPTAPPTPVPRPVSRAATSRSHPTTRPSRSATRWCRTSSPAASTSSVSTTRWAPVASRRSTTSSTPAARCGRSAVLQVHRPEHRCRQRQDRDSCRSPGVRQRFRMHAHQSLWKDGKPLFYDEAGYAACPTWPATTSASCHAGAVLAFTNPTLNSYHRLVPGFEAPINLVYSQRNRSAAVRIPITGSNPKAKRLEFRAPDPSGNPYFGMAAMMLAGLDGIKNRIEPHAPVDKDLYELPPEEAAGIPTAPTSLEAALKALEENNEFLTEGGVFTEELIETYIAYKYDTEISRTV